MRGPHVFARALMPAHARRDRFRSSRSSGLPQCARFRRERWRTDEKTPWFQELRNFSAGATSARLKRWPNRNKEEYVMRNLLLALATGVLLIGTVPASAQIYGGVD